MTKRILLTGGTGFLGSSLIRKLLQNDYKVVALKRSFSNTGKIQPFLEHKNLELFDIDKGAMESVFKSSPIETIIHTATDYGRPGSSAHQVLETNLVYPIQLLELGIKYGSRHFINTDSYFNKESYRYTHLLNYSLSKRSLVQWLKNLSGNIHVSNMMLEHLYGPGDDPAKFVGSIIRSIAVEKVQRIPLTHGHQKRDFIFVDDVADAYVSLLGKIDSIPVNYSEFQVGTGVSIPVRTFVETIKTLSNSSTDLGFGDIDYRSDEFMDSKADNSGLLELGWSPKVSMRDGILRTLNEVLSGPEGRAMTRDAT